MDCPVCNYRPLKIARICPKCHTPTLVAVAQQVGPEARTALVDTAIAVAWSDGTLAANESAYLEGVIKATDLPDDNKAKLRARAQSGLKVQDIALPELGHGDSVHILEAAAALIACDGEIVEAELVVYNNLAVRLGIGDRKKREVLEACRRLAWV